MEFLMGIIARISDYMSNKELIATKMVLAEAITLTWLVELKAKDLNSYLQKQMEQRIAV